MLRCNAAIRISDKHRRQPGSKFKNHEVQLLYGQRVQLAHCDEFSVDLTMVPQARHTNTRNSTQLSLSMGNNKESIMIDLKTMNLSSWERATRATRLGDKVSGSKYDLFKKLRSEAQYNNGQIIDPWWKAKKEELQSKCRNDLYH